MELIIASSNVWVIPLLAGQITGIGPTACCSSKKVFKIIGPALSRINSVIISARTVNTKDCEGFIRHRPLRPHPGIHLALPSSGVDWHRFNIDSTSKLGQITGDRCRVNVESTPEEGREGEVDSRVGSGGASA